MTDMSNWKTLQQIRDHLDHVDAVLDGKVTACRTLVYRTEPGTPCPDCGLGYREDPADPESYIPHAWTDCPAIS